MEKKTKNIYLGIIIIVIILIIGFWIFTYNPSTYNPYVKFNNNNINNNNTITNCSQFKNKNDKILCKTNYKLDKVINLALINNNITKCNEIFEQNRHLCYDSYYFSKHNSTNKYCTLIKDEKLKKQCLN